MSKPLISIVIPTHNSAHMIGGAIRSCFAQTLRDFEIIVVDDERSTDSIESVLAPFAGREIRFIRGFRGGAAAARNGGHRGWVHPTRVTRRADVARAQVRQTRKRSRAVASARQELGRAA